MEFHEFMQKIGLGERAMKAAERISLSEAEIKTLPQASFLDAHYTGDRPDYVLALFARYLAAYSEEPYAARGVTQAEWLSTMRDLAIWCEQLLRETGELGVRETAWLSHLVRTEIFRLGRLQFVPRVLQEELRAGERVFPAGTRYAEVHIPAGGKLLPEEADLSFARARELFVPAFFTCESWLLSPKLKNYLQKGNILDFAARFHILSFEENNRSAERYLFGDSGGLAAWVRERAGQGDYVGSAYGICVL